MACSEQLTECWFLPSEFPMTVPPVLVTAVTGGIVATQGRVLAVAMMALEISVLNMQKMISNT